MASIKFRWSWRPLLCDPLTARITCLRISLILIKWSPRTSGCTDSSGSFLTFIFISHSPWQPARTFNQTSGGGVRFHLAGAVTKINDRIFVVLARRQHFHPGWLTLLPPLLFPVCSWATYLGPGGALHIPIRARTCKAMSKWVERIPGIPLSVPVAWPGVGFLGEREEEPRWGWIRCRLSSWRSSDLHNFLQP